MKILVTSGGTTEYIDEVRVLTNISTGNLGSIIADTFAKHGFEVTYLSSKSSILPTNSKIALKQVTDVQSVMEEMEKLVPQHDVVIHSMAVSDFGFKRQTAVKLKSNSPEAFADYIRASIFVNPKVVSYIKKWNPSCLLISFKFEVGKSRDELAKIAVESMRKNSADLVVANDKIEMNKAKDHVAYLIEEKDNRINSQKVVGKLNIAEELVDYVRNKIPQN